MIYTKIYDRHEDVSGLFDSVHIEKYYIGFDKKNMIPITTNTFDFDSCKTDEEKLIYSVNHLHRDYENRIYFDDSKVREFLESLKGRKLYVGFKLYIENEFLEISGVDGEKNLKLLNF